MKTQKQTRTKAQPKGKARPKSTPKPRAQAPATEAPPIAVHEAGGNLVIDVNPALTRDLPALTKQVDAAVVLADMTRRNAAYDFLKQTLRPRISQLRALFTRIKSGILDAHKKALAEERAVLAPYLALDDRIETAVLEFDRIERERREKAQFRIRLAQRAAAVLDESDQVAVEDLLSAAAEMETAAGAEPAGSEARQECESAANELWREAEELIEKAEAAATLARIEEARKAKRPVEPAPASAPPPPVKAAREKGRAVGYRAEIRDFAALIRAVAAGSVSEAALEPDKLRDSHPWLNDQARQYGAALRIPGVVAVESESLR